MLTSGLRYLILAQKENTQSYHIQIDLTAQIILLTAKQMFLLPGQHDIRQLLQGKFEGKMKITFFS